MGPGAFLALLVLTGELFVVLPALAGVALALTSHVTILAFVMGAGGGTFHRTHAATVQAEIDERVTARTAGTLLVDDPRL